MNSTKHLIIPLLIQDMKHEQLMAGLSRLGFNSELHSTDASGVVAELMGLPEKDMSCEWFGVYVKFLKKAVQCEITADGSNLLPLAELCYAFLVECKEKETANKNSGPRLCRGPLFSK